MATKRLIYTARTADAKPDFPKGTEAPSTPRQLPKSAQLSMTAKGTQLVHTLTGLVTMPELWYSAPPRGAERTHDLKS